MTVQLEELLYFGVMGIAFLTSIIFAMIKMKKARNFGKTLIQTIALSFLLFSLASIWWFYQASDGFSQVFGGLFYGLAFVFSSFFGAGILLFMKKKN